MPLAKKLRVPRKNKISIVRSTDAIFVLYRQIAASRLPQRYTRVGIYTEIPEVFLRLLPFRKKKKHGVKNSKRISTSSGDRSNEPSVKKKTQRIRSPIDPSYLFETFHARTCRTIFSDTTRRVSARERTRHNTPSNWDNDRWKQMRLRHRMRVERSLLPRHTPAGATTDKDDTSVLTYTCVVNAHTRRRGIDRVAGKSAASGSYAPRRHRGARGIRNDRNREIFLSVWHMFNVRALWATPLNRPWHLFRERHATQPRACYTPESYLEEGAPAAPKARRFPSPDDAQIGNFQNLQICGKEGCVSLRFRPRGPVIFAFRLLLLFDCFCARLALAADAALHPRGGPDECVKHVHVLHRENACAHRRQQVGVSTDRAPETATAAPRRKRREACDGVTTV